MTEQNLSEPSAHDALLQSLKALRDGRTRTARRMETIREKLTTFDAKIAAIELVLRDVLDAGELLDEHDAADDGDSTSRPGRRSGVSLSNAVRSSVSQISGAFEAEQVAQMVRESNAERFGKVEQRAVAKVLSRLARREGSLKIVQPGSGPNPAKYQRVDEDESSGRYGIIP